MSKPEPDWRSTGGSGKAHLLDRTRLESRAWCGADLRSAREAGFEERCRNCLQAVQSYLTAASEAVPVTLTEAVYVEVARGVNQRDLFSRICTFLASGNCRHLEVHHVLPVDVLSDAAAAGLLTKVTAEQGESLRHMNIQRGRTR